MCLQSLKALLAHFIAGCFRNSSEQSALQTGKLIFLLKIKIRLSRAEKETGASQRTPEMSCAFHHGRQTNSRAKPKPGLRGGCWKPRPGSAAAVQGAAWAAGSRARGDGDGTGTALEKNGAFLLVLCSLKEEEAPAYIHDAASPPLPCGENLIGSRGSFRLSASTLLWLTSSPAVSCYSAVVRAQNQTACTQ